MSTTVAPIASAAGLTIETRNPRRRIARRALTNVSQPLPARTTAPIVTGTGRASGKRVKHRVPTIAHGTLAIAPPTAAPRAGDVARFSARSTPHSVSAEYE